MFKSALWIEEYMNDTFESGLRNDKLPLLYLVNQRAKNAVKISQKLSEPTETENVVIQEEMYREAYYALVLWRNWESISMIMNN